MSQVNDDTVLIDPQKDDWPPISPYETGLKGRCPRCGKGRMFATYLRLCKTCEVCGLDYSYADPADGPAFFAMTFFSLPPTLLAVWLEAHWGVSYLTNALITLPVLLVCMILPLRPLKGWLVASQYFYKAEEGSLIPIHRDAPETRL